MGRNFGHFKPKIFQSFRLGVFFLACFNLLQLTDVDILSGQFIGELKSPPTRTSTHGTAKASSIDRVPLTVIKDRYSIGHVDQPLFRRAPKDGEIQCKEQANHYFFAAVKKKQSSTLFGRQRKAQCSMILQRIDHKTVLFGGQKVTERARDRAGCT